MVRRIGEMLGLETEAGAATESVAGGVEVVTRVELQTRLRRGDLQRASRCRLDDERRPAQRRAAVEHEVVIVPVPAAKLLVIGVDPRADRGRRAEVERRALDRSER